MHQNTRYLFFLLLLAATVKARTQKNGFLHGTTAMIHDDGVYCIVVYSSNGEKIIKNYIIILFSFASFFARSLSMRDSTVCMDVLAAFS